VDNFLKSSLSRIGIVSVSRSTALNPILWAFGFICAACVPISSLNSDPFWKYTFIAGFVILLMTLVFGYVWFLLKDPDRLQSEHFRLKQQSLELMHKRDEGFKTIDSAHEIKNLGFEPKPDIEQ
jgi:hypothetical protein